MRALRIWFLLIVSFTLYSCGKTDGVAPSQPAAAGSVSISPASVVLAINNSFTFSATGGTPPYFYTLVTGSGSISSTTGVFNAPGVAGLASVRVTDSLGTVSDATITINAGLQISPTAQSLSINQTLSYSASGGVAPFVYSIVSGVGSINASSGLYTAPASSGSANVRVTDSLGNTSNATVNVFSALGIAPTPITIAVNNTVNFSAGGGTGPYTYSVFSGGGTVNASTGVYTAPGASGSATVRVTDSLGATASATITINAALAISPVSQTTLINSTISFSASGGVTPYSYSIISGSGSINAISGSYTAPAANGVLSTYVVTTYISRYR